MLNKHNLITGEIFMLIMNLKIPTAAEARKVFVRETAYKYIFIKLAIPTSNALLSALPDLSKHTIDTKLAEDFFNYFSEGGKIKPDLQFPHLEQIHQCNSIEQIYAAAILSMYGHWKYRLGSDHNAAISVITNIDMDGNVLGSDKPTILLATYNTDRSFDDFVTSQMTQYRDCKTYEEALAFYQESSYKSSESEVDMAGLTLEGNTGESILG